MLKRLYFGFIIIFFNSLFYISQSYADYNSFTVNIPNSKGGYTAVEIKQSGAEYVGPKGELYSSFPSVSQLQAAYGTTTAAVIVSVPTETVQPSSSSEEEFFTVNITNFQGGHTPIAVRKSEGRFFGPLGENYANFPTVQELQVNYGPYSPDQIKQAIQQPVLKVKMLNEMITASMAAQQRKLDQQSHQNIQAQQQAKNQAGQVTDIFGGDGLTAYGRAELQKQVQQSAQQQSKQTPIGAFLSKVMDWINIIMALSIIGICGYTCFQASKGRMLFFYNWYDLWGSFALVILYVIGGLSGQTYLMWISNFACLGYNAYMSYKYYYPRKQYLNMVLVGFSRIMMSTFIPFAYVIGLFFGPKKDDSLVGQAVGVAFMFGWYYYLTRLLFSLVNGHLLVELEEETARYNQYKEKTVEGSVKKTPYEILGVSPTDTIEKIKAAYKGLMMKYHPDRMGGLGEEIINFATMKTQEINAAYDFILNAKGMNRG